MVTFLGDFGRDFFRGLTKFETQDSHFYGTFWGTTFLVVGLFGVRV